MNRRLIAASFLLLALGFRASAQVTLGDNLSMNLNGTASFGYTADYGSLTASDHGITAGGNADLTGSYYSPNFLQFHIQPFYNQSRVNSDYQSISDSSGVTASAGIFSGSHFPGSVSYSKTYNSDGNFALPGVANYTTHGNGDVLSVGWGVNIPDRPTVAVGFQEGNNDYSIYGTNAQSGSHFDSFTATSSYLLAGFNMNANYHYTAVKSEVPEILTSDTTLQSNSDSSSFALGISHALPLHGAFSAGASHSDTSADFTTGSYSGNIDTLSSGLSFSPTSRLTFGSNAQYNDNLAGTLYTSIIAAGGAVAQNNFQQGSHALDVNNYANYHLPAQHLTFSATYDHREQSIFGSVLSADSYSGTVDYSNSLFGGFLNALVGLNDNRIDQRHQSMLGLIGSINYSRVIRGWQLAGGFNYAQDQQTLLVAYTTSSYGYSGSVGRRIGATSHISFSASGTRSALNGDAGSGTYSQNYSAAFSLKKLSFSGAYSASNGNAILTGGGLVPTPVPLPIVTPSSVILYGGHSYSFGLGSSPFRRLTISASYSKSLSDTLSDLSASNNRSEILTTRVQYLYRQLYFQAGYSRLIQGFSLVGGPPTMLGSYYIGVSRWFNFF